MPLALEFYNQEAQTWIPLPELHPENSPGSVSHNTKEGREVYMFECAADDSKSTIYRSVSGLDFEIDNSRVLSTKFEAEIVKELKRGEKSYEFKIKNDRDIEVNMRLTHI